MDGPPVGKLERFLRETIKTLIRLQTAAAKDESKTKNVHQVVFMIAIKFSGEEESWGKSGVISCFGGVRRKSAQSNTFFHRLGSHERFITPK